MCKFFFFFFLEIRGYICTEPRLHINQHYESTVGSVTDCHSKLEVKYDCDISKKGLTMGTSVILTGILQKFTSGPPVLRIENTNDVDVEDSSRIAFVEILKGYRTK